MIHRASFDSPPSSLLSAPQTQRKREKERYFLQFLNSRSIFPSSPLFCPQLSIPRFQYRGFVLANRSRLSSFVYIQGEDTGGDICRGFGSRDRVRDGFFLFFFLFWKRKRSFNLILSICLLRVKISAGGII